MPSRKEKGASEFERSLLRGMKEAVAVARGNAPTRVYTVSRLKASERSIAKPPAYTKDMIVMIRKRMGVSQPIFADVLNVSTPTVRGWEQGVREPEGPSLRLLEFAARQPTVLLGIAGLSHVAKATAKRTGSKRTRTSKRSSKVARHK